MLFGRTQLATAKDMIPSAPGGGGSPGGGGDLSLFIPAESVIWGTLFFVVTCISVVVGPSYGFWVVPAVVIAVVLGSGTPSNGASEVCTQPDYAHESMLLTNRPWSFISGYLHE